MKEFPNEPFEPNAPFDPLDPRSGGWALVEIMGHRAHAGFIREVSVFGVTMCVVDVPFRGKPGVQARHVYGGSALFSVTPVERERCMASVPYDADRPRLEMATWDGDEDDVEGDEIDEDRAAEVRAEIDELEPVRVAPGWSPSR